MGIRFSKDGKLAFIALSTAKPRSGRGYIDLRSEGLHSRRPAALAPVLQPEQTKLYVVNGGLTNDMTVVDAVTLKPETSVPVGRLPWGVMVKP